MIPSTKILKKQAKKLKLLFDLDKTDYFKLTFEYIELKQMFLGMNPTNAYKKISLKLKKK